MELSLITPVAHLKWTKLLPGRFCIAPIAIHHKEYREYFYNAGIAGYKVILDNGVFEDNCISTDEYIALGKDIRPAVLIVPDKIGSNALDNYTWALRFADEIGVLCDERNWLPELMHVLQCQPDDILGFERILQKVIEQESPFKWIGICRDAIFNAFGKYTHTTDQELNRYYFSCWFEQTGYLKEARENGKKFHFLGIGENLELLAQHWYVDSMDTASLFFRATHLPDMKMTIKRPSDYFIRDFGPEEYWLTTLRRECNIAAYFAGKAKKLRLKIEGNRL